MPDILSVKKFIDNMPYATLEKILKEKASNNSAVRIPLSDAELSPGPAIYKYKDNIAGCYRYSLIFITSTKRSSSVDSIPICYNISGQELEPVDFGLIYDECDHCISPMVQVIPITLCSKEYNKMGFDNEKEIIPQNISIDTILDQCKPGVIEITAKHKFTSDDVFTITVLKTHNQLYEGDDKGKSYMYIIPNGFLVTKDDFRNLDIIKIYNATNSEYDYDLLRN